MRSILNHLMRLLFARYLRARIRDGSLRAVRFYIRMVQGVRIGTMFAVLAVALVSAFVTGLFSLLAGAVMLLPIRPDVYPYILLGVGAVLVVAGVVTMIIVFNEKRWLETTQAYAMMDKVVEKFPEDSSGYSDIATDIAADVVASQASNFIVRDRSPEAQPKAQHA